jgi:hypothetical protein
MIQLKLKFLLNTKNLTFKNSKLIEYNYIYFFISPALIAVLGVFIGVTILF